jgi:multidrug transporter EmrE-like cation transporter
MAGLFTAKENPMNTTRLIALALIVAGVLGLAYGGFTYTKDTTAVKLGPLELSVKEKQTVNVPIWAGIGAIVVGGLLLVMGNKKG